MKPPYTTELSELATLLPGSGLDDFSKRVLSVICKSFHDDNEAPSEGEIERVLGASSRGKVARTLERLEKLRYIYKEPNTHRGIRLLEKGAAFQLTLFPSSQSAEPVDSIDEKRKRREALLQEAIELDLDIKREEEERAKAEQELLAREQMRRDTKICSRCGGEFPVTDFQYSVSWHSECYFENAENKNRVEASVREIIAIVKREGGGRLAKKAVIDLVNGLAKLPDAHRLIKDLARIYGKYNKRSLES